MRNGIVIILLGAVLALPFIFRRDDAQTHWREGDPVLVILSPMNEAIRYEFGQAFSDWHEQHYGRPVKMDWRNIGGTTEIMRYMASEFAAAFRAWWLAQGNTWPAQGAEIILDRRFNPSKPPPPGDPSAADWEIRRALWTAFRATDDPNVFTSKMDLFFGGGAYDQDNAYRQGLTVAPWPPDHPPPDTVATPDGRELIPLQMSGEIWRTDIFYGTCLSTFGICWNEDRRADLGIAQPPLRWADLADPAWFGHLGVADPTKSGSIAKAFEMIVHEQCGLAVAAAGFTEEQADEFERMIQQAGLAPGIMPESVPSAYQTAVEQGWLKGLLLLQKIGANARYFTDAAGKVPVDVAMGNAAAGISIDFYSRYEAEVSKGRRGATPMRYVTPAGGSSVSADPIALLRGAPHRETAVRFIAFTLSEAGQKLWNYAPGTPGGPEKYALRRLPIRRDFYPATPPFPAFATHLPFLTDDLADPAVNPYELARHFTYHPRWTAGHFNFLRDFIRAMCLDSGEELRAAWGAIIRQGGPKRHSAALEKMERLPVQPEPITWASALQISRRHDRMDLLREWTIAFRRQYREAEEEAEGKPET